MKDDFHRSLSLLALVMAILAVALVLCGCDQPAECPSECPECPNVQYECGGFAPTMDLPAHLQVANYTQSGSCGFAATANGLESQGNGIRSLQLTTSRYGAVTPGSLVATMKAWNINYDYTDSADERWLLRCQRNRRLPIVLLRGDRRLRNGRYGGHAINFVRYDGDHVVVLDNNSPGREIRMTRARFLEKWDYLGGFALVLTDSPGPPKPPSENRYVRTLDLGCTLCSRN